MHKRSDVWPFSHSLKVCNNTLLMIRSDHSVCYACIFLKSQVLDKLQATKWTEGVNLKCWQVTLHKTSILAWYCVLTGHFFFFLLITWQSISNIGRSYISRETIFFSNSYHMHSHWWLMQQSNIILEPTLLKVWWRLDVKFLSNSNITDGESLSKKFLCLVFSTIYTVNSLESYGKSWRNIFGQGEELRTVGSR